MASNMLASFADVWGKIWPILVAILILLLMITVHEFGHYIVGKIFKFKIDEFAIGFGPAIVRKQKKNGEYFSIRALPLGGYCAFHGEDNEAVEEGDFNSKPPWQRILVLIAGATMNLLLALVMSGMFLGIYGAPMYKIVSTDDYEAQAFMAGDIILQIEDKDMYATFDDFAKYTSGKSVGDSIKFTVLRDGKKVKISAALHENDEGKTVIGITMGGEYVKFGFFETIGRTFAYTFKLGMSILSVLGGLITGKVGISSMGGTFSTITATAQGVKNYGFPFLLQITALIGVNLGVFNLLPIPALDGSKVVFTTIEWIRGKPINRNVEAVIHLIGFVLLIGFAVLVDLQHCF